MTVGPPACMRCKHYRDDEPVTCDAFPLLIPDLIWLQGNPHTSPVPGDQGIHFEPIDEPRQQQQHQPEPPSALSPD